MTRFSHARADEKNLCRLHLKTIDADIPLPAISETVAARANPAILGANEACSGSHGFSYWAWNPLEIFEFLQGQAEPFTALDDLLAKYRLAEENAIQLPKGMFRGGWIGWFGYELGRYIEKLPQTTSDDLKMPLIRLAFYDRFIACDHQRQKLLLVAIQMPGDAESPADKLAGLGKLLKEARKTRVCAAPGGMRPVDVAEFQCNMTADYYYEAIDRIKRYIYDGDVYQINFSQRFEGSFDARPVDLFHWENLHNPSGYAAYLDTGDFCVVSASPEMFITIVDGRISTKPIKGTRPRLAESADDPSAAATNAANYRELLESEKEKAELNMIVDLERNDLARICRAGTRRVIQPRTIENYPTVLHAVATVAGELRDDVSFCDCLKAVFPGGSITGAPKIRAMEIIDETEPTARGVYTGSIGFIGLDGGVCLNIAIRTVIISSRKAFVQTGGGIVADSDPRAEWDETITKAEALLAGIRAVNE